MLVLVSASVVIDSYLRAEVTSQTGSDVIIIKSCRFAAFFPSGSDVTNRK